MGLKSRYSVKQGDATANRDGVKMSVANEVKK